VKSDHCGVVRSYQVLAILALWVSEGLLTM
jgi:hypothetical protein